MFHAGWAPASPGPALTGPAGLPRGCQLLRFRAHGWPWCQAPYQPPPLARPRVGRGGGVPEWPQRWEPETGHSSGPQVFFLPGLSGGVPAGLVAVGKTQGKDGPTGSAETHRLTSDARLRRAFTAPPPPGSTREQGWGCSELLRPPTLPTPLTSP